MTSPPTIMLIERVLKSIITVETMVQCKVKEVIVGTAPYSMYLAAKVKVPFAC